MNVSLYQAAAALNANSRWQEVVSGNLASSSVPGFRKQEVSFAQVEAGLPGLLPGGVQGRFHLPTAVASTNFQPGTTRPTGGKLDFAVEGSGFFEVQLPNGDSAYTRDGEFQLNGQGQLVTKQGFPVLSDGGPLQFDTNNPDPIGVAADETVSQGSDLKGRMRLVEFASPEKLTPAGAGMFITGQSGLVAETAKGSSVRQGYLEAANTNSTIEMSNLIAAMRMFEANTKVMTMQDERLGKVINELGSPN